MSFEEQNPGDCPGCREYEQERQRLVKENEDLRLACATYDATLTETESSVERLRAEQERRQDDNQYLRGEIRRLQDCDIRETLMERKLVECKRALKEVQEARRFADEVVAGQQIEIDRLKQFLRTCVDKMIDYEVDDTQDNADFIVDCAAAAGPYPDE